MANFIIKRCIGLIITLLIVATITFLLIHFIPGDPAATMLGVDATPERIMELRERMGLDQPIHLQALDWFSSLLLEGDLGDSLYLGRPVTQSLLERFPNTLQLAVVSLLFSIIVGIPTGMIAAIRQNTIYDGAVMAIALIGVSLPSFWIGLILIAIFCVNLGWLPTGGFVSLTDNFYQGIRHLILPGFSLGLMQAALIARMTRSSMLEIIREDYIRTARSKGVKEFYVLIKHAFRNAIIPIITVIGLAFGVLLCGAVVVETVFAFPGVGRLTVSAVQRRDYPLIQGSLLMVGGAYAIVNFLVDLLYGALDPRIKYE